MDELIAFLRQQLDEDERVARAAAALPHGSTEWFSGAEGSVLGIDPGSELHVRGAINSLDDIGVHIARWDPARVLAEVEAKRRILDEHKPMDGVGDRIVGCHTCSWRDDWDELHVEFPCPTVRLLAKPYAGRDGWREEWRA